MRKRRTSENALQLSFLDVLSCGLGAAVLLFLIFSLIGEDQPLELSSPNYIMIRGKLDKGNTNAILRTIIDPPDGPITLLCMERNPNHCRDFLEAGEIFELGSSKVLLSLNPENDKHSVRRFAIRVLEPVLGEWKFEFRYDVNLQLIINDFQTVENLNAQLDLELTTRDKPKGEKYKLILKMNRRTNCSDAVKLPMQNNIFCPDSTSAFKLVIK